MSRFTLLLGGELVRTARLDVQIAGSRVIAADSGITHAGLLGLTPELWLGDFDSTPAEMLHALSGIARMEFPEDKDMTDGELAIEVAKDRGATSLVLAGAFGGPRSDHAFLHLAAAVRLAETGLPTLLTSGTQEGFAVLPGTTETDLPDGSLFSILAFSDLSGLTLEGAKWPLAAVEVPFGSSLTLSNQVRGRLTVRLGKGHALLLAHPAAAA